MRNPMQQLIKRIEPLETERPDLFFNLENLSGIKTNMTHFESAKAESL